MVDLLEQGEETSVSLFPWTASIGLRGDPRSDLLMVPLVIGERAKRETLSLELVLLPLPLSLEWSWSLKVAYF